MPIYISASDTALTKRSTQWLRHISLRHAAAAGAVAILLSTTACDPQNDPLYREGLFQPGHTNRNNLTLMVANPSDLVRGTGTTTSDGQQATAAIERWRNDKIKKLPAADLAQISAGSSGDNNSGGGGGGGGGAGGQ
jgi:type IV pilus biogenesis protein CpaD/CtpE